MVRLCSIALLIITLASCATSSPATGSRAAESDVCAELAGLDAASRDTLLAMARLFRAKPRLVHDFSKVGMHALVGPETMITFAGDRAKTKEDILFYIPAKALLRAQLNPEKLPKLPAPGEMVPGRWYYLEPKSTDPRFGNPIGFPVIVMSIDVE